MDLGVPKDKACLVSTNNIFEGLYLKHRFQYSPFIMQFRITHHQLDFKFDAGTSRGVLRHKDTWFVHLWEESNPELVGVGEAGPLKGLSVDDIPDFEERINKVCEAIDWSSLPVATSEESLGEFLDAFVPEDLPSLKFALETAIMDLRYGGKGVIYETPFTKGEQGIVINGLIWMGEEDFMAKQIEEKLAKGFTCVKMKIGAIDFETEIKLLKQLRTQFPKEKLTLRVDANGAFSPEEAPSKLARLAELGLHSIEQPIKAGQVQEMRALCENTPLPIALDEELIGVKGMDKKRELLEAIMPQYIILKPTLVGGIQESLEWIQLAKELNIGWWMTSALESNIGLNAVAQLTAKLETTMPQGLGTGQLYHNNIPSPLVIEGEKLWRK